MREIKIAKSAGFCFGVKRAVNLVYDQVGNAKKVYTYGPIIHNEEVVSDLERKGVYVLSEEDIDAMLAHDGREDDAKEIVIRSHGIGRDAYKKLEQLGFEIVDATCPFVKKIHRIVQEETEQGHCVVIVGDENHPEVCGIRGWCVREPIIVNSVEQAQKKLDFLDKNVYIVAQTTFNDVKFKDIVEFFRNKGYNVIVYNTICNATEERQREARALAADVDTMIVIGGKSSSNTQKLYEICRRECENTYYIQTLVDLDLTVIESAKRVGITAGASTPNKIIKEVHGRMDEMNFEELLKNDESRVSIKTGEIVEGRVIDVKPDEILVDISYKSDGIIPRSEYTNTPNADLTELVHVDDPITAKVVKTNDGEGSVLLSYKRVAAEKANEKLEAALESGEILTGKVVQVVSGGLNVMYDETRVFIPASLVSDTYEKNLDKYLDQDIEFVLTEYQPKKRRIIGNRKQIVAARKAEAAKALFDRIEVGMIVEGVVKNVTSFGAFMDLGGADGLLHISEMSWGRVDDPKSVLKVGDTVKAFIKNIDGEKIALSLKFDDTNPWLNAAEKYAPGTVVTGKVARMADFGAFIELEPGVDALLHVSQISYEHVNKPEDVYKVGDEVEAVVVECNADDKKISLSVKELLPAPEYTDDVAEDTEE